MDYKFEIEEGEEIRPLDIRKELENKIIRTMKRMKNPSLHFVYDEKIFNWKYVIYDSSY